MLTAAGFKDAPKTWEELGDPGGRGHEISPLRDGLALSNVGDGNVQMSVMQSYGGRIADDAGKTVTIKSDATRTYLQWVKDAWDKGLFPPGVTTWDGAGDNQAYLAGQAAFIANTGCVAIAGEERRHGSLQRDRLLAAAGRPEGRHLADQPERPRDLGEQQEHRTRPRRWSNTWPIPTS